MGFEYCRNANDKNSFSKVTLDLLWMTSGEEHLLCLC